MAEFFHVIEIIAAVLAVVGAIASAFKWGIPALRRRHAGFERFYLSLVHPSDEKYRSLWRSVSRELNVAIGPEGRLDAIFTGGMPLPIREDNAVSGALAWMSAPALTQRASALRADPSLINNSHGLLSADITAVGENAPLKFVATDYAMIRAAREAGHKPPIISAGAIVFCPADRTVLLQRRSQSVATYPGCLHVLGGNYEPAIGLHERDDLYADPLQRTALREVGEESRLMDLDSGRALVTTAEECATGFVQFIYAGIAVDITQKKRIRGSDEGGVSFLTLAEIVDTFRASAGSNPEARRWVPSGALHVLAWLGIGAPNQHLQTPMLADALAAYRAVLPHVRHGLAAVDGARLDAAAQ